MKESSVLPWNWVQRLGWPSQGFSSQRGLESDGHAKRGAYRHVRRISLTGDAGSDTKEEYESPKTLDFT
jgi:hypothetical protein